MGGRKTCDLVVGVKDGREVPVEFGLGEAAGEAFDLQG